MSTSPEIWYQSSEVIAAIVGATVALFFAVTYEWLKARRRRRAHLSALRAEMEMCRALAETYLRDEKKSPLYRLPTMAYANSLPELLGSAALDETETRALLEFFNEVETLNRGLEQAQAMRAKSDDKGLNEEVGRNIIKAGHLVPGQTYYHQARSTLDSRLRWHSL